MYSFIYIFIFLFINRLLWWYFRKLRRLLITWGGIEGALGNLLWSVTGNQSSTGTATYRLPPFEFVVPVSNGTGTSLVLQPLLY